MAAEQEFTGEYVRYKTVAQGALDLALLMSNANILKAMVEVPANKEDSLYDPLLGLIIFCVILQAITGIMIGILGAMSPKDDGAMKNASRLNMAIVAFVILITVINVFITAFGVTFTDTVADATNGANYTSA